MKCFISVLLLLIGSMFSSNPVLSEEIGLAKSIDFLVHDLDSDSALTRRIARRELFKLPVRSLYLLDSACEGLSNHVRGEVDSLKDQIKYKKIVFPTRISGSFHGTVSEVLEEMFEITGTVVPDIREDSSEFRSFTFRREGFWRAVVKVLREFSYSPFYNEKEGLYFAHSTGRLQSSFNGPLVFFVVPSDYYAEFSIVMLVEGNMVLPEMYDTERIFHLKDTKRKNNPDELAVYKKVISYNDQDVGYHLEIRERVYPPFLIEMETDIRVKRKMDFSFIKSSIDPFRFVVKFE